MDRDDRKPQDGAATGGQEAAAGGERIAKALARAGVASRREVERLIAEGKVAVNGVVLTSPGVKVGPKDILTVDGAVAGGAEPTRLWRYHKPAGLVTSHADPKGRPTVFDALPKDLPRVISIGRLDLSSEGLLLLTNDGGLSRALELPANGWVRRYRARAYGQVTQEKLDTLKDGITVEGVVYGAIEARLDKAQHRAGSDGKGPANLWISVGITEGKNREVRRVLEALGLKVNRLIRLAYGPFALGTLAQGEVEEVGPRVIRELLSEHIAPANLPKGDSVKPRPAPPGAKSAPRRGPPAPKDRRAHEANPRPKAPKPRAAAQNAPTADAKPVYKAGWAKPKKRPNFTATPKPPRGDKAPRGKPKR